MPKRAELYMWGISLSAGLMGILAAARFDPGSADWVTFAVLLVLATIAQLFHAEAPNDVIYYATPVFIFAGIILLPSALFVVIAIIPALVEWMREALYRKNQMALKNWLVFPFNISLDVISGLIAHSLYSLLMVQTVDHGSHQAVLNGVVAAITFMLINHLALGVGLVLRGKGWRETGLLDIESSLSDLTLLLLGFVVAKLWRLNPWLIIPALSPLVLMYRALLVPKLKQEAQSDPKTGLLNARYLNTKFAEEIERAYRGDRSLALIVSDLDYLRTINNTYGHLAGDVVLIGVGKIIGESVGEQGLAARFGGEEFAIVLPDAGYDEARALAERVRSTIEAHQFAVTTSPEPIRATMSFGIACFPDDGQDSAALFHEADIAAYHAKLSGRNRVVSVSDLPQAVRLEGIPSEAGEHLEAAPALAAPTGAAPRAQGAAGEAQAPATSAAPPRPRVGPFIGAVIAAGLALGAALPFAARPIDMLSLSILILLAIAMEWLQIDFYGSGSLSVSAAVAYAAALMGGLPGLMLVSAAIAITAGVVRWRQGKGSSPLYKLAFNWAAHSLAGTPAALVLFFFPSGLTTAQLPLLVVSLAITGLIYFVIDTGLVAAAVAISQGGQVARLWREQYRWLMGHYLVLCFLGGLMTIGYLRLGLPGLIGFVIPVFMMRFAQQQYVQRTERAVHELKRLNAQLTVANRSIGHANRAIHQINEDLLSTLAQIIDARDPSVSNHSAGVAWYATRIAAGLGLPDEQVETIRQASLMHDIGKIAIPEHILHKPGKLTDDEYREVQRHAAIGADLLEPSTLLRHLAPFVRHHHERWDGMGYPCGLRDVETPIEARIIAVCDTIETMESDRAYQPSFTQAEIVAELTRSSGSRFDPAVVEAALAVLADRGDSPTSRPPLAGDKLAA